MNLSEKIKHLREVEGDIRGFGRPMTQMEVVRAMQEEMGETISQAYRAKVIAYSPGWRPARKSGVRSRSSSAF